MEKQTALLVLDAAVAVKWFVPEKDSPTALKLKDAHTSGNLSLFAPDLLTYEVANALRYRSSLTSKDLKASIDSLFELDLILVSPTAKSLSRTSFLARTLDLTIYDASYLELAESLDCKVVTSDQPFLENVSKSNDTYSNKVIFLNDGSIRAYLGQ